MTIQTEEQITLIPVDDIYILNPRARNYRIFLEIQKNMENVGIKRPITVTPNTHTNIEKPYILICGQGRLEAFKHYNQPEIPALIIEASEQEALIMSLVENLARRNPHPLELLHGIKLLKETYNAPTIAKKIGLNRQKVYALLNLLDKGEDRLLTAVEAGHMPVSVAADIARSPENEQKILQDAYEKNELRGSNLKMVRRLLEKRNQFEKKNYGLLRHRNTSPQQAVKVFQDEINRKQLLTRKANIASTRMTFVIEALRHLLSNDHFNTLLKAEKLNTLPKPIHELIEKGEEHAR